MNEESTLLCIVGGCSGLSKARVRFNEIRNITFYASFTHTCQTIRGHARQPFIHLIWLFFSPHVLILPPSLAERRYLTIEQPVQSQKWQRKKKGKTIQQNVALQRTLSLRR